MKTNTDFDLLGGSGPSRDAFVPVPAALGAQGPRFRPQRVDGPIEPIIPGSD